MGTRFDSRSRRVGGGARLASRDALAPSVEIEDAVWHADFQVTSMLVYNDSTKLKFCKYELLNINYIYVICV